MQNSLHYYTGNRSVALATDWIFDHPELDLETPLEEEIKQLQAKERTQHYPGVKITLQITKCW